MDERLARRDNKLDANGMAGPEGARLGPLDQEAPDLGRMGSPRRKSQPILQDLLTGDPRSARAGAAVRPRPAKPSHDDDGHA